jgi:DNA-binding IclR family transcriptional regulator
MLREQQTFTPVKSSERTLAILEHLARQQDGASLGELSKELGVPKSSLHALLRTMQQREWVQADRAGVRFRLGVRSVLVGASYVESDEVVDLTRDILDDLADALGETVHLGRLDGPDIVYLAKRESHHPLRLFSAVGRRLPAHATALGKAILAMRSPEDVSKLLPSELRTLTSNTITNHAWLTDELVKTRERGYALDDQENTEGIRCVAVPLLHRDVVRDAISCSVPIVRLEDGAQERLVAALQDARRRAESRLNMATS